MRGREHALYAPLGAYLQDQLRCTTVRRVGEGKQLRLRVPDPHRRVPDVVGARETHRGWETLVVEAKPSQGGAAAVPQALGQLAAISPWSDFLYLALERRDWDARSGPAQQSVERELASRGYGLLLVSGDHVESHVEPSHNRDVDPAKRNELLGELGVTTRSAQSLPVSRLSFADAEAAAKIYAATLQAVDWVAAEWVRVFKQKSPRTLTKHYWELDGESAAAVILTELRSPDESIYAEADPFGTYYATDAEPRVWIWKRISKPEPFLTPKMVSELRGWWLFADHEEGVDAGIEPLADVQLKDWLREGFNSEWHIGYPIRIMGRSRIVIGHDVRAALALARGKLPAR
jgi:hypothetical protein